jgi:hypothetical protein
VVPRAAPGWSSAMLFAIQQASALLRPLILILPASGFLPIDKIMSGDSKRKSHGELNSSDEGSGSNRGGYRNQFRSRQHILFPKSKSSDQKYA